MKSFRFYQSIIFLTIITVFPSNLICQNISFEDCSLSPMYVTADTAPIFISDELTDFFLRKLPSKYFKRVKEPFIVQILVDENGNPCCSSILETSNIDTDLLMNTINEMPSWIPAKLKGNPINISVLLRFIVKKGSNSRLA